MLIKSNRNEVLNLTVLRDGETKIGQVIRHSIIDIPTALGLEDFLEEHPERYVILGIPEDIGIRANFGRPGASQAYRAFLSFFLNTQSNRYIDLNQVLLLGEVFIDDLQSKSLQVKDVQILRGLCSSVDDRVAPVIEMIIRLGKTPIVIGGGHNNAYGMIRGASQAIGKPIEVLNIDPHFDCRAVEGRHSGNGFSYAMQEGFLARYHLWGYHEAYNNANMMEKALAYTRAMSFEDILFGRAMAFRDFIETADINLGVELDLDSIQGMPSSAMTPSGFTVEQARGLFQDIRKNLHPCYYHLPEGMPADNEAIYNVGKFLTYIVRDILAPQNNSN